MLDKIAQLLSKIYDYAIAYAQAVFQTIIAFWQMREVPNGANILTGAFGAFLIVAARFERSLASNSGDLMIVFPLVFVCVLFLSIILLMADPGIETRLKNFQRLVSVICVGVTLSCGLIAFAWVIEWSRPFDYLSDHSGLGEPGANRVVSAVAALVATTFIFVNTTFYVGARTVFRSLRIWIWSACIYLVVALSTGLAMFQT
jgi:hypothetical protein